MSSGRKRRRKRCRPATGESHRASALIFQFDLSSFGYLGVRLLFGRVGMVWVCARAKPRAWRMLFERNSDRFWTLQPPSLINRQHALRVSSGMRGGGWVGWVGGL